MPTSETLTFQVEPDLRERFDAAATALDRTPHQVLRELMQDYVDRAGHERDHDAWFRREVERGLREADDGSILRIPDGEIAAEWDEERRRLLKRIVGDLA